MSSRAETQLLLASITCTSSTRKQNTKKNDDDDDGGGGDSDCDEDDGDSPGVAGWPGVNSTQDPGLSPWLRAPRMQLAAWQREVGKRPRPACQQPNVPLPDTTTIHASIESVILGFHKLLSCSD